MSSISIVVFDDNKPRRELLQLLINSTEDMQCKGAFEDCREVLKRLAESMPDVVLMDIDMPHVNGIEGLKLIHKQFPQIKVLMQTVFEDEEKIFDAICAGADGYLLKKTSPDKLLDAIRDVHAGGAPMTPTVAKQVLQLFNNKHNKTLKNSFDLTTREQEILKLLVQGLSYKMIAGQCNISYPTVNTHISHIYEKLHVSSAVEAVTKAMNEGIV
ncbi:MAG: response regulator [Flavobacteriales bacterium]